MMRAWLVFGSPCSRSICLALDTDDLTTVGSLDLTTPLAVVLAVCAVAAIMLIVLAAVLSRPKRSAPRQAPRGAHRSDADGNQWRRRIDEVVTLHDSGVIDREDAFTRLAAVARDYASTVSGKDMSSHTLNDLAHEPRRPNNRRGLDLLRQTIEALYPAEFADAGVNTQARDTSVEQAAEWVSTLVERWR